MKRRTDKELAGIKLYRHYFARSRRGWVLRTRPMTPAEKRRWLR